MGARGSGPQFSDSSREEFASIDKQIAYLAKAEARLAEAVFYEQVARTLRSVTAQRQRAA